MNGAEDGPPALLRVNPATIMNFCDAVNAAAAAPGAIAPPFPLHFPLDALSLQRAILEFLRAPGAMPPEFDFDLPCTTIQLALVAYKAHALAVSAWALAVPARFGGHPTMPIAQVLFFSFSVLFL